MLRATLGALLVLALPARAYAIAGAAEHLEAEAAAVEPAKKQAWLADKQRPRPARRPGTREGERPRPVVTLVNVWTQERLPVVSLEPPGRDVVSQFLRCRFTNQRAEMAPDTFGIVLAAARKFAASKIEIISGFRSPKHNLWLRKKLRSVARESQHVVGTAIDFRIPDVPLKRLLAFVRSLRKGGVGYYPNSRFVHADLGPVRYWKDS